MYFDDDEKGGSGRRDGKFLEDDDGNSPRASGEEKDEDLPPAQATIKGATAKAHVLFSDSQSESDPELEHGGRDDGSEQESSGSDSVWKDE